jgi:hypothetical protein
MVRWSGITDPPCIAPRTDFQHAGSDIDPRPLAARRWADYSHGGQGFSEEDAMRRNLTAIGLVITMGIATADAPQFKLRGDRFKPGRCCISSTNSPS